MPHPRAPRTRPCPRPRAPRARIRPRPTYRCHSLGPAPRSEGPPPSPAPPPEDPLSATPLTKAPPWAPPRAPRVRLPAPPCPLEPWPLGLGRGASSAVPSRPCLRSRWLYLPQRGWLLRTARGRACREGPLPPPPVSPARTLGRRAKPGRRLPRAARQHGRSPPGARARAVSGCRWPLGTRRARGAHCCSAGAAPARPRVGVGSGPGPPEGQPGRLVGPLPVPPTPAAEEVRPRPRRVGAASGPAGGGQVGHGPPTLRLGGQTADKLRLCSLVQSSSVRRAGDLYKMRAFLLREDPQSLPRCAWEKGSESPCVRSARLSPASCRTAGYCQRGWPLATHSAADYRDCYLQVFP